MKETPVSNIEKSFITEAIFQGKRTDGRHLDERRNLEIHFGHDYGSCLVSLGETKVSAQVSCSVLEPRPTRPNEGLVFIHVDFLPMSSPRFVNKSKISDEEVNELTRILERNIKESRTIGKLFENHPKNVSRMKILIFGILKFSLLSYRIRSTSLWISAQRRLMLSVNL